MNPRADRGRVLVTVAALAWIACRASSGAATPPTSGEGELGAYRDFIRTVAARTLLATARESMRSYWSGHSVPGSDSISWPGPPVTIYVTLVGPEGTRACVGGPPVQGGLSGTVCSLARRALHSDPRHAPIRAEELEHLRIAISFAGHGRPLADPMQADPGREGLLVTSGERSVAFIPGEARTVSWALREARRIHVLQGPAASATYRRFPVVSVSEPAPNEPTKGDP